MTLFQEHSIVKYKEVFKTSFFLFSNLFQIVYGTVSTQTNNTTVTYTLCKSFTSVDFKVIGICYEHRHWMHACAKTLSTFDVFITDISANRDSGFQYIAIGF